MEIYLMWRQELEKVRRSGRRVVELLSYLEPMVKSGVNTLEINDAAEKWMRDRGNIREKSGQIEYPLLIYTSVNEAVCNAFPSSTKILKDGDIIDITVALHGCASG